MHLVHVTPRAPVVCRGMAAAGRGRAADHPGPAPEFGAPAARVEHRDRDGVSESALVTLIVEGKVVTGQARFERNVANISGTVLEDGSFGATIAFQHLRGSSAKELAPHLRAPQ